MLTRQMETIQAQADKRVQCAEEATERTIFELRAGGKLRDALASRIQSPVSQIAVEDYARERAQLRRQVQV
jgi:hypothetical protein